MNEWIDVVVVSCLFIVSFFPVLEVSCGPRVSLAGDYGIPSVRKRVVPDGWEPQGPGNTMVARPCLPPTQSRYA